MKKRESPIVPETELRRRQQLAQFNAEILSLKGDELLDRVIAFNELPPPDPDEIKLRRAMRYTVGAALINQFGLGKGEEAVAHRLATRRNS